MKAKSRSSRWIDAGLAFLALGLVRPGCGVLGNTAEEGLGDVGFSRGELVELQGGAIHRREVELEEASFLHVLVEQRGIDVKVALIDPAGGLVWEVDSPNGAEGPEELVAIVPSAGDYLIEVTPWDSAAASGTVVYRELARRPSSEADRELVAADRSYHRLRRKEQIRTVPSVVIDGLEPVAALWRSRGFYRREADTLIPLCDAYLATSDNRSALAACERAAEWYRAFEARHLLVGALRRAVIAHGRLGATEQALRRAEEALALAREMGNPEDIGLGLQRLGEAHFRLGDLQAALDAYDEALASLDESRFDRGASIGRGRARILLALRRPDEARGALRAAAAAYRRLDRPRKLALTLSTMSEAYLQLGNLEGALEAAKEAVALLLAHDDPRGRGLALKALGTVLRHRQDFEGARRAFENALALFEEVEDPRSRAVTLNELGHLRFLQGDGAGALKRHEAADQLSRESGDLLGMASSQARGAQALTALGRLDDAWQRIVAALDQIEEVRSETARSDFRLSYFAFRREYARIAVDVAMELHARDPGTGWDARALAVNDRGLARELVDAVARAGARPAADPRLSEEQRALERQLRSLVAADPLAASSQARRRQIEAVLDRLHDVRGKMRQASGAADRFATRPELDVTAIQRLLGDRDLLLVYALGEATSRLWSLTSRDRQIVALRPRKEIEPWAREFVIRLEEDGDREPGRRLWDLLIAPAAERLRGVQRLVIVADGALHSVPFAALPMPHDGRDGRERYLLENHEVVMVPSLAILAAHRRASEAGSEKPAARAWLAVFADPVFTQDDPRLAGTPAVGSHAPPAALQRSLAAVRRGTSRGTAPERLPGTRIEADAIRARLGENRVRVFTGPEVERQKVIATLSAHRVVHFATHGFSHPRPELSGLLLSLFDAAGRPQDGFLPTLEIARLDVTADLVVLSACETARSREMDAEGVLGMTWGFLHAGAAQVVASLWKVGDAATARLMTRFYERLDAGRAPSTALREAQLALVVDPRMTPYHWAGFVFQGDWQRPDWP